MEITAVRCREKPKYGILSAEILEAAREWFRDPEHEREFQEWKKEQKSR